jgi:hypothetical protein
MGEKQMIKEFPMFSPYPKAKLYKRYEFIDDNTEEPVKVNNMNYKTFKWMLEQKDEKGIYKPTSRVIVGSAEKRIKTNTRLDIEVGDIVFLTSTHTSLNGSYTVANVETDFIYTPKPQKTYTHLLLKNYVADKINLRSEVE